MEKYQADNTGQSSKFLKNRILNRKKHKELLKDKRAKLVIKNLPFKATEESIRSHFGQYGEISKVNLLKKPDGKLVGCAFVQFNLVQFAKQARHYTNNKPFLGRNIIVDFAQAKDKYISEKFEETIAIKGETEDNIKNESSDDGNIEIHDATKFNSDLEESIKEETSSQISESTQKRFHSHDVHEGKTVFIKNVPFQATNEDLKECMSQYGPLYYALICMDKLTEHSKGTAFVKFVNKEDADKALSAGTELTLLGNVLDCHPAIDKDDLKKKEKEQNELKTKSKDSRNLYLVKEGVILAGTSSAEGVSASDMAKRLQIEQYKTQMLRNLHTFVSRERLVVHNLPAAWDDAKLRMLCQKHGGKGAVIKEARVMRDLRKLNSQGVGESKRFGFVAFSKHEHALAALRSLNNNPKIFSAAQRPIICFSIESKTALKAKLKRQEKSMLRNPKSKNYEPILKMPIEENADNGGEFERFTGLIAKQGVIQKMRSRYKLNQQAKIHSETLKKEKRKQKLSKKTLSEKRKDFIKQPKQKVNNNRKEDNFSKLVSDYKQRLKSVSDTVKKVKWYE
ncbi:hypothetical protein ABEB36_006050 [Hypothenemus hampei]|uniref:RRM domain-containing protein n=1 Tax=Hypothenemus hampei TaxID=57062 RepID=A0ABD1F0Y9_HYPHA